MMPVIAVREYIAPSGKSAYARCLSGSIQLRRRVSRAIDQAKAAWTEYKTLKALPRK